MHCAKLNKKAFTLIELLIVISLIGILAALIIVGLRAARFKAFDVKKKGDISQINRTLEAYAAEHEESYPISYSDNGSCTASNSEKISDNSCAGRTLIESGYLSSVPRSVFDSVYSYLSNGKNYTLQTALYSQDNYFVATPAGLSQKKTDDPGLISQEEEKVLIIVNKNSPESIEVGEYYKIRRNVPNSPFLVDVSASSETISETDYTNKIETPIKNYLTSNSLQTKINYIVLTHGIPYKINSGSSNGHAVDSMLAGMFRPAGLTVNPYKRVISYITGSHNTGIPFDTSFGIYMVMRLDGPSSKIAKGLVDKAIYAGNYLGAGSGWAYMTGEPYLQNAITVLCAPVIAAGYECKSDPVHLGGINALWHVSGGDNYGNSWDSWRPGAIPIHFQSFTARDTIRDTASRLAVVNNLAADATGTYGASSEPYAWGIPQPNALLDYFLNGNASLGIKHFNYAQSIYMATQVIRWRWLALGDPLYIAPDDPAIDSEKPKIDHIVTQRNGNTITVSWDNYISLNGSPEVTHGAIDYGLTQSYGQTVWDETALISLGLTKKNYLAQHKLTIINTDPSQTYYVKIRAIDPTGNESFKELTIPVS
ncbi:MAG: TIGR03790 family protein [bacterium]|nr:TIGR03790 family protein [bacterium]